MLHGVDERGAKPTLISVSTVETRPILRIGDTAVVVAARGCSRDACGLRGVECCDHPNPLHPAARELCPPQLQHKQCCAGMPRRAQRMSGCVLAVGITAHLRVQRQRASEARPWKL